jgi:Polyketide cyclase / dehydrase and lipid transport
MEYVRETTRISVPVARVWAMVAGFGAMEPWCPAIKAVELEGHGIGSIRSVYLEGIVSREKLLEIDPAKHMIVYSLLEPSPLPLRNIRSTLQLLSGEPNLTEVIWFSEADEIAHATKVQVGALVGGFYRECLSTLKAILESGRAVRRLM